MMHLNSKICIVGDFAVGKTSTVERFVNNQFSEKYLTTIGVKVDTKEIELPNDIRLKLIIWDIAGTEKFSEVEFAYLRGASGYILVADGTRAHTIASALDLKTQAADQYGEVPLVFLLNKSDLEESWEVSEDCMKELRASCSDVFVTSAKKGKNVHNAIKKLGKLIVEREVA